MENLICSCCGAKLVPTTTTAFLTCEYCDNSISNPHYDAAAASEAARPDVTATALSTLREMGAKQNLASIDADCFGEPITGVDSARRGLSIPDGEQVWFLLAHNIIILGFSDGLALTDTGLYYSCDSGSGSLSWETFINGGIACVQSTDDREGVLQIGSGLKLTLKGDKDARLAAFLVDFHNQVYQVCTGQTAPSDWCVHQQSSASAAGTEEEDGPSLLDAALSGLGLLFGTSTATRVLGRNATAYPTSHPTVRQDRRDHVEPPRPLHTQPHRRPAQPATQGGTARKIASPAAARINQRTDSGRKVASPAAARINQRPEGGRKVASPAAARINQRPGTASKAPGGIMRDRPGSRPGAGGSGRPGGMPGRPGGKPGRGGR
ncbi:MAG: hypothetical protein IJE07_10730 [Clostridia bacterium]|nr:hypothetical protein [Clostridia bacterium]